MEKAVYVVSDTESRKLSAHPTEQEDTVILCRVWKPTAPGFVGETDVMEVSLTELEQILNHYNGGGEE